MIKISTKLNFKILGGQLIILCVLYKNYYPGNIVQKCFCDSIGNTGLHLLLLLHTSTAIPMII